MNRIPVGVLGASGYAGRELTQLILAHPGLELVFAAANEQRGTTLQVGSNSVSYLAAADVRLDAATLIFSCLPHGASGDWVGRARNSGALVVDLSADLRPGSGRQVAPYGLTEVTRSLISEADVVANPGCYATCILLALAPLLERGLVSDGAQVVINAASGVSGAGNSPSRELLFGEIAEDFRPYSVGNTHRHLAEMRATAASWGADIDLVFTPHLLPVSRGILATIAVPLREPLTDALRPWRDTYRGEAFVEVSPEPPKLRDVIRRNAIRISAGMVSGVRTPTVLVLAALDNLLKGAAGQALQNANLMLGLPETTGLPA